MNSANPDQPTCYVIITPVRDEAQHIEETIKSITQQTTKPAEWVIVDDGSTDGTAEIIDRYAAVHPWIRPLHKPNRGFRDADIGAVQAALDGFQFLEATDWQFIVNLDGDLDLDPPYFERCFQEFDKDANLGIGGGTLYNVTATGATEIESNPDFHVRGATKIYRRACWEAIGGLPRSPGWDTLDEVKANMLGWRTRSFPHVRALHRRPTGAAEGAWRDRVKCGRASYVIGYHPVFLLAKCARHLVNRPVLIGSVGLLWGFVSAYLRGIPRVNDPGLISYLRRQQLARLLGRETIWR
jgi:glycosyltransferase involved in cell wall biosynthesis